MSKILRGDRWVRPYFKWGTNDATDTAAATGQVVESLRNLSEDSYARLIATNNEMLRTLCRIDRRVRSIEKRGSA